MISNTYILQRRSGPIWVQYRERGEYVDLAGMGLDAGCRRALTVSH